MKERVTVLMPAYNAEKYIGQAIESILAQTLKDFVFLIIDDGSTDNTASIVRSYSDSRILFLQNDFNIGVKETLNKGLKASVTEYIARMDADDIAEPERLFLQQVFMDEHPEVGVLGSAFRFFGMENRIVSMPLENEEIKSRLFFFSGFCHPTVMIRNEVLKKNNVLYGSPVPYQDDYGHKLNEMEDTGFWHKLKHLTHFANLAQPLLKYRIEGQNISSKNARLIHQRKRTLYKDFLLKEITDEAAADKEIDFLFTLQYFKDDPHLSEIRQYRQFLNKVIKANQSSGIYNPLQFEISVEKIWTQFFYFITTMPLRYVLEYWKVNGKASRQQLLYYLKYKLSKFKTGVWNSGNN